MRLARSLTLSLALVAAVASAHRGGRHPTLGDRLPREDGDRHYHHHEEEEVHGRHHHPEKSEGLGDYLRQQFEDSTSLLQQFLGLEADDDVVVVVEEEPEALTLEETRLACLTALTRLREQDELQQTGDELASRLHAHLRSAFQLVSVHYLDETSCEDLSSPLLVDECNRVVDMEEEVRAFLDQGQSDAEVCEIIAANAAVEEEWELEDCSEAGSELSCTMCKRFVEMVDQALEQQAQGIEQVRAVIGDLCEAMAEDSMCHVFLKHYDEVVDWLKHGTDPAVVCVWLQMCSASPAPLPEVMLIDSTETEDYALAGYEEGKKPHGCFFCVHVADVVRQVNKTEPEKLPIVKTILDNVCKLTPTDCKCDEIDKDFDKLVELVKQGECPHKICKELGFCKKPTPDNQLVIASSDNALYDSTCVYCDAATTFLEIVVQEQPDQVDMIREYADMICSMLGDDNVCHQYVTQLDSVIDSLKKGVHPRDICKALKYCTATGAIGQFAASEESTALVVSNSDVDHHHYHRHGCKFCIQVGIVIHHVNKTEPTKLPILKDLLSEVCQLAPADCNCTTIAQNFDKIVELESEGKCPFQACKAIGVCKKKDSDDEDDEEELTSADDMDVSEAVKSIVVASVGNDTNCAYCTYATTIIRIAIMQYGQEIAEIRQYADMICDMLGADSECHAYVSQLDAVLDAIKAGKSSHEICAILKYCSASSTDLIAMRNEIDEEDEEGDDFALTTSGHHHHHHGCSFCIRVAMVVRHVNKTAPAKLPIVKKILDDACQLAPTDCKCDEVDKNFDKIVELVKNGTCPVKICKAIGICKKPAPLALTQNDVDTEPFVDTVLALVTTGYDGERGSNIKCYVCDYVTALVQVALEEDQAKVEQIRSFADSLCDLLGDESGCHQYVKQFSFVLDSLKNGTLPHAVCESLKYCTSDGSKSLPLLTSPRQDEEEFDPAIVVMMEDAMIESVDNCFFCSQVTTVVQVVLQQNPSQIAMVRQIADMVCGMLPAENKCHEYVKDFDTVVDALKKGKEPKQICQELKYCPAKYDEPMALVVNEESAKGNTTCAYCSGLVTVLKYALAQDTDQVKQLREAAGIVCELLPADDQCHEDLKLFDQAVKELDAGKEPHVVCQDLKFCEAAELGSPLTVWDLLRFVDPEVVPSKCSACKQNTLLLATMVSQPDRLATFSQELDTVCRLIPDSDECQLLMDHQDEIVAALKSGDNVNGICSRINACEPSVSATETDDEFSVGCMFCEYTAELIKVAGTSESELRLAKSTLETMCTILPPCAHCDVLSSKFDELVTLLQGGKTPGEACRTIALCSASLPASKSENAVAAALEKARVALGDVMEIE